MGDTDLDSQQNKNIHGLSFKSLKNLPSFQDSDFLFVDEEIEGNSFFSDFKKKFREFYVKQQTKNNVIEFVLSLGEYIATRISIIFVLLSVLFDILFSSFNSMKDNFATKMFWGRGNFLSSAVKVLFLSVFFILAITYLYRKPIASIASGEELESVGVAETDVMVMNSSVNTIIPKDRGRRNTEKYIVMRGDTLAGIAQYYGLKVKTIMWANDIKSENSLKLGQELDIPPQDGVVVVVKSGDTIASLAKKYNADPGDIVDFNWIENGEIAINSELFIPNGEIKEVVKAPVYAVSPSISQSGNRGSSSVQYNPTPVDPSVGKFLGWPVGGPSRISRGFFTGHYGIDIYPTGGQPSVVAAYPGTVISAGWGSGKYNGFGYYVHVDHGNGYTTLYAHMAQLYVRSGQAVGQGQALGQIGATGVAYGIHVHFELRRGAELSGRINPAPYML